MKILYTIGFTKKSAKVFFETLKQHNVELLLDIRLNNNSQLAGYTKSENLPYFLKTICNITYMYTPEFAPTKDLLEDYKKKKISWDEYERRYYSILEDRDHKDGICKNFSVNYKDYNNIVLLCSEDIASKCHRRLLAEQLCREDATIKLVHL